MLKNWDEAEVLDDVLLGNEGDGNRPALAIGQGVAKEGYGVVNALGVMGEHAMEQLVGTSPAAIHPSMNLEVIGWFTAKGIDAADGVIGVVSHQN